ncbi:MAG: hypothetical protein GKS00_24760 [Alphaproteobacteria bacterium]|nr:hypothetical protein [Alphaproteobacteria bacterium]
MFANGGFDLVLGNPPWETMSPDAKEFFSPYDPQVRFLSPEEQKYRFDELKALPGVQAEWDAYCDRLYRAAEFMRRSGRYKMFAEGNLGKGDFNVYRLFVELALTAIRPGARAAQFVPENLYNGANAAAIRKHLFTNMRLQTIVAFENTKKIWFDIDSRAKFCLYVAIAGGQTTEFDAAFGVNSIGKLQALERECLLQVPVSLVEEFSPEALAISEITHPFDIEIVKKLYSIFLKFGADDASPASREYQREIDMGNDRGLFTEDPSGIPIYEGRMVEAFDHRAKAYKSGRGRAAVWDELRFGPEKCIAPQWRILVEEIPGKIRDRWMKPRIGFCDVASPTNQRSLVAAIIPGGAVCGHKVPTITFSPEDARLTCFWLGVANSFCMDFLVRKKVSLTMSFTLMDSLPLPRTYQDSKIERAIASRALLLSSTGPEMFNFWSQTAPLLGLDPSRDAPVEEPSERRRVRSELDILVARDLCGLTVEQLRYLMEPSDILGADCGFETFGALKRADTRNFDRRFETRDEIIAAWDRLKRPEAGEDTRIVASVQPPVPIDPAILPDGAWATPPGVSAENLALFALIDAMRQLDTPAASTTIRVATILARRPAIAAAFMDKRQNGEWSRLVGQDALPLRANVVPISQFQPNAVDHEWGTVVQQLKAVDALIESIAGDWSIGANFPESSGQDWMMGRMSMIASLLIFVDMAQAEQNIVAFIRSVEDGTASRVIS